MVQSTYEPLHNLGISDNYQKLLSIQNNAGDNMGMVSASVTPTNTYNHIAEVIHTVTMKALNHIVCVSFTFTVHIAVQYIYNYFYSHTILY
jgi:hypothetical protein